MISKRRHRWLSTRTAAVIVIALGVTANVSVAVVAVRDRQAVDCLSRTDEQFRVALLERATADDDERKANRDLAQILATPAVRPGAHTGPLVAYVKALDAADAVRRAHPLPTNTCD